MAQKEQKRRILTHEEFMQMSEQEKYEFAKEDERLLSEGIGDKNQSNIDFQGMTIEEIVEKYEYIDGDVAFDNIFKKLGIE